MNFKVSHDLAVSKKVYTLYDKEWFVSAARTKHGDKFDYTQVVFTTIKDNISIKCPIHGEFTQQVCVHIRSKYACPKCAMEQRPSKKCTTEEFVLKAKAVHNDRYTYDNVVYTGANQKISIGCTLHGNFTQKASHHLSGLGCPKCGVEAMRQKALARPSTPKLTVDEFVTKAKEVHGSKYVYNKVVYSGVDNKVDIRCRRHGVFSQTPYVHLQGSGCPKCGNERQREFKINNPTTWSYTDWEKAGTASSNFQGFSLYIIECSSTTTGERFIKVGKTFVGVAKRFASNLPYKYRVISEVFHNAYAISTLEHKIHTALKEQRYVPKRPFGGDTECFLLSAKATAVQMAEL